jgi:nicotinamide-nucleotide amidase
MNVDIISIGDELLIGQTINTNAAWMGKELSFRGAAIRQVITIKDSDNAIYQAIDDAMKHADVVLVTGGLGPTKDDITKQVICTYFKDEIMIHEPTLKRVQSFFEKANQPMLDVNIQQAAVPKSCEVLTNRHGTAPGMLLKMDGKWLISLPGVPYEMKGIMLEEVFPRLESHFQLTNYYFQTVAIQGVGESYIADTMQEWEMNIRQEGLELAYLPSPGLVRLRISSPNGEKDKTKIETYFKELKQVYPQNVFGNNDESLVEVVHELFIRHKLSLSTAESCTGGAIAASVVSLSGSSAYFKGGFVTYSNEMKHTVLGVDNELFDTVGAVSEQVVKQMAQGGRAKSSVDYCVAVSGIAGPDGGTEDKPVGTVWIAVAGPHSTEAKKFLFSDNRERIIQRTVLAALNMVRVTLMRDEKVVIF